MPADNPLSRPTYNDDEVQQIYDRIQLPDSFRYKPGNESRDVARGADGLRYLSALKHAVLTSIPFENLELHYSPHKVISLLPDVLFDKFVTQGTGRGGYCMENNVFFGTLLRTLGFKVTSAGARAASSYQSPSTGEKLWRFIGWSHMVNLVTIDGERYLVDVGYGPGGPTKPLALRAGDVKLNVAPNQSVRLRYGPIPDNEDQNSKLWIFERRNADDEPFVPVFCFPDNLEFLPGDFEVINYRTSTARTHSMTYQVVCAKFLMDEQTKEIVGDIILHEKSIYRRIRGQKEDLGELKTETDRIEVLEKHLGVVLSEAQKRGIARTVTALPA